MFDEEQAKTVLSFMLWQDNTIRFLANQIKPYRDESKLYSQEEQKNILLKIAERYNLSQRLGLLTNRTLLKEARIILRTAAEEYWTNHEKELLDAAGINRPLVSGEAACLIDLTEERLRKELNIPLSSPEQFRYSPVNEDMLDTIKPHDLESYIRFSAHAASGVKDTIIGRDLLHDDLEFTNPVQKPTPEMDLRTEAENHAMERLLNEVNQTGNMTPVIARFQPIGKPASLYTKAEQKDILNSLPVPDEIRKAKPPAVILRKSLAEAKKEMSFVYEEPACNPEYANKRETLTPNEEPLVEDLSVNLLLKEFNMQLPSHSDWQPAKIHETLRPERLDKYVRLAKAAAQWIKSHYIGMEKIHTGITFTDPIRDYAEQETVFQAKKGSNIMEPNEEKTMAEKNTGNKRMSHSRRPALYKETSEMIRRLADEVLKAGSIEPIVDRFARSENPVSRTQYRAVNAMILRNKAREMGYTDDRWITFNQAKAYNLHLNKGQKGVIITHYGIATQKEIDEMKKRTAKWNEAHPEERKEVTLKPGQRFAKDYFVYNAEQFSSFPEKTPEYTKDEQSKILSKIHETTRGADAPIPENTSPREILHEAVSYVAYGQDSPLQNVQLSMSERMMISELAAGILHKELDLRTPLRPDSYQANIIKDDEMGKEAFDRIREKPTRIVAYLNMAETLIDQVKDQVIGRDLLHPEIPFSERMGKVDHFYSKAEQIEYGKAREAGLTKWEIENYMRPEIQEKWPKYRERFSEIKNSVEKSIARIHENMQITPRDEETVTCEAPRTLLEKIRTAERRLNVFREKANMKYPDPKAYLKDFKIKNNTFSFTMSAKEKDPILAACNHKYEVRFGVEATFYERRVKDLLKQIERDVEQSKSPNKDRQRTQDKGMERTR